MPPATLSRVRTTASVADADARGAVSNWNFADIFEAVAAAVPQAPAQVCGQRRFNWSQFDRRSDALAASLLAASLGDQAKVAAYLYNGPEYLETYFAAFKAGLVPVNTNFRYGPDEIRYLFDDADAEAVVFHSSFGPLLEKVRNRLPKVKAWFAVNDAAPVPSWALDYETIVGTEIAAALSIGAEPTGDHVRAPWGRSGDQLILVYTGGTTGMPKGVMWRQDDLFNVMGSGGNPRLGVGPATSVEELADRVTGPGAVLLPACPLMHGTGQFTALVTLALGGCIVTLANRAFQPDELFETVERERVNSLVIVGDAFAKPMLASLVAGSSKRDLSSLSTITSSGVMCSLNHSWSGTTRKRKPSRHHHDGRASTCKAFTAGSGVPPGVRTILSPSRRNTLNGISAIPSSQGIPACLILVNGEAPVPPESPEMRILSACPFATPAATVPTPTSETSLTLTRADGLEFFRSKISCDRSSIE